METDMEEEALEVDAKLPKFTQKTIAACKLVEGGMSPKEALKVLNKSRTVTPQAVSAFKHRMKRWSLTRPDVVNAAGKVLKDVLKGKPREEERKKVTPIGEVIEYTDKVYPSFQAQITVAQMVFDRLEPIRGTQETGPGITVTLDARTTERIAQLMIRRPSCLPEPLVDLSNDQEMSDPSAIE